jgi:hypothetical protein
MDPSCRFVVVCDLGLAVARSSWAPARSTRTSKLRHGFCTIPMDAFMTTWAPYQQGRTAKEIKNKGMIQCWTLEMMHGMVTGGPMVTQSTERGLTHCDSVRNDVYGFFSPSTLERLDRHLEIPCLSGASSGFVCRANVRASR